MAKQAINSPWMFALMETGYLLIQFGVFGVLTGIIYAKAEIMNHEVGKHEYPGSRTKRHATGS